MTAQEYIIESQKLFNSLKESAFVTDGIIDTDKWFESDNGKKNLVILKEAYIKDRKIYDWDLTKWIRGEQCCANRECGKNSCDDCQVTGSTYNRVAEWIYGINEINSENIFKKFSWLGLPANDQTTERYNAERKKLLCQSAVINIKKVNGARSSSHSQLKSIVEANKENLRKQIETIQPDIIICGGTIDYLKIIYGTDYNELEKKITIIDSSHPNARKPAEEMFKNIYKQYHKERQ